MECHGSIGSVRPSSFVGTATRRKQVDAYLQTSDVVAHQRGREQDADSAKMIVEHLDFELRSSSSHRFQLTQLATASRGRVPRCDTD